MHFSMVVNWREKKECGHDAKEGADKDSVYSSVPLKSVGLNVLIMLCFLNHIKIFDWILHMMFQEFEKF